MKILIVGAGFSGATFAYLASNAGIKCHLIDKRDHIGGNCFSYEDKESGIEIHKYGPHIFHTSSKMVWNFINNFSPFNNYINRVKACYNNCIYSFPINLHTINQFYNKAFNPVEAMYFIEKKRIKREPIKNFEDYIVNYIGIELFEAFYKYYTIKQWKVEPREIPISTAKRLPIRLNYNDNYYNDTYQGIPLDGYTKIFERMLKNKNIDLSLNTNFEEFRNIWKKKYNFLIFTGSIDEYFKYEFGVLPYIKVKFKKIKGKDIQGNAVINYTDMSYKFTRIHEHKWFKPSKKYNISIGFEEYSEIANSKNYPFYPIINANSKKILKSYKKNAIEEKDVIFLGRLAEFKYMDMHQVIENCIKKFNEWINNQYI